MTNVIRKTKPAVRDIALNLEVLVEDAAWQPKITRLKKRIVAAIETALLAQHKFKLKSESYDLSLVLTNDARMRRLNRDHRAKDKPTNVLSFPMAEGMLPFPDQPVMIGDIVLAFGVIEAEAKESKKPFANHMVHLIVHGVLHLCGYDHISQGQARTMERLEKEVLKALNIPDPYQQ